MDGRRADAIQERGAGMPTPLKVLSGLSALAALKGPLQRKTGGTV
jgi:hypothetical protein